MRKAITIIFAALVFGCNKQIDSVPSNTINSENVQNATMADTYLPLTKGTYWNYSIVTNGKTTATSKLTVLGVVKKIYSKNYQSVKSVDGGFTDTVFYNQTGHDYYVYTNSNGSDTDFDLEILFLRDNLAVGKTWTASAGSADGVKLKAYGKIVKTNSTITVGGKTYTNVIQTHIDIKKPIPFLPGIIVYKQDYYVAKNIGIVKNIGTSVFESNATTITNLTSYSIK